MKDRAPGWSYDPTSQKLTIRPEQNFHARAESIPSPFSEAHGSSAFLHGYAFRERTVSKSNYVGTNAFGALVNVRRSFVQIYGLADFRRAPLVRMFDEVELKIAPERARLLTTNIRLRVEGVIEAINGLSAACFNNLSEPTFSNPREEFTRICVVSANIRSVKVVDLEDGAILFERSR